MRKARVEYPSGREVLKDYWGYLTSGGLVVADRSFGVTPGAGMSEGERVEIDVRIASLRKEYRLAGRVAARRRPRARGRRAHARLSGAGDRGAVVSRRSAAPGAARRRGTPGSPRAP